jgi:hypothetical protein
MIAGTGQRLESWKTRVLGQAADTRQQEKTVGTEQPRQDSHCRKETQDGQNMTGQAS